MICSSFIDISFHLVDRCTRWHHAKLIKSKEATELIRAIDSCCGISGPMSVLVVDGERGIVKAEETKKFCKAHGIDVQERAPDQHARVVERR